MTFLTLNAVLLLYSMAHKNKDDCMDLCQMCSTYIQSFDGKDDLLFNYCPAFTIYVIQYNVDTNVISIYHLGPAKTTNKEIMNPLCKNRPELCIFSYCSFSLTVTPN